MLIKKALLLIGSLFCSFNSFGGSFEIPQADESYRDPLGLKLDADAYTLITFASINKRGRLVEHVISMDLSNTKNYQLYDNIALIKDVELGAMFLFALNDQLIPYDEDDFDLSLIQDSELFLRVVRSKDLEPGAYKGLVL